MLLANLDQNAEPEDKRLVNGSRGVVTQILPLKEALAAVEAGLARAQKRRVVQDEEGGGGMSTDEIGCVQTVEQLEAQKAKIEAIQLKMAQQQAEQKGEGGGPPALVGPQSIMFPVVRFKSGRVELITPFGFSNEVSRPSQ
jgi:hypothetical protein